MSADGAHLPELERIAAEYRRRDAGAAGGRTSLAGPAFTFHIQELEWEVLRILRDSGLDLSRSRVLDVGCGSGYLLHRLHEFGAREAQGIDLMPGRVEEARRRYPVLDVRQASATELPFDDGRFDLVTQFTCLSSVLDTGVRRAMAAEMWRVLRPGGLLLSYDMRPAVPPARAALRALAALAALRGGPPGPAATPVRPLSAADLRDLYPAPPLHLRRGGLHPVLAEVARWSRPAAVALSCVPVLRSHLLAVFRKPGPPLPATSR